MGREGRLKREGQLINFLPLKRGGGELPLEGGGLFERGSQIEDLPLFNRRDRAPTSWFQIYRVLLVMRIKSRRRDFIEK